MRFRLAFSHYIASFIITFMPSFAIAMGGAELNQLKAQYERPTTVPFPRDNPYSAAKAQLGKMLFFDQRLSRHFNLTCATCHNPSLGWEDGVPRATGDQNTQLGRHSPTILNAAWGKAFFWDGRAATLEQQARGPIEADVEMNTPIELVVERLYKIEGYRKQFNAVFEDGLTAENIQKAIATFERTIVSGTAPFDRWVEGSEAAISEQAKQGFILFNGKAGCNKCHSGWNFTDHTFHDIGLDSSDEGRFNVSQEEQDRFAFKTPGLRNIGQRKPYMHNGSLGNLDAVLMHYVRGGIQRPTLSKKMLPIALNSSEVQALKAFLTTLDGEDKPISLPILPL